MANGAPGLLPSATLQPYGEQILKYGIGQLGTPIDVGAMLPKVAGQTAFQQKGAQRLSDMYGMGDIQRDATGQVTGFTGGTGIASYQPYLDQISQQQIRVIPILADLDQCRSSNVVCFKPNDSATAGKTMWPRWEFIPCRSIELLIAPSMPPSARAIAYGSVAWLRA